MEMKQLEIYARVNPNRTYQNNALAISNKEFKHYTNIGQHEEPTFNRSLHINASRPSPHFSLTLTCSSSPDTETGGSEGLFK